MAIFTYVYTNPNNNQPVYRTGVELGAIVSLDQDTLLPVLGENAGVGDNIQTVFPLAFNRVREGSVHVYIDAIETFDFIINLQSGVITFDVAPAGGEVITVDYNHIGDITFTYDTVLPMTISGNGIDNFNNIMNNLNTTQNIQTYFTVDAVTDVTAGQFNYTITVDAI